MSTIVVKTKLSPMKDVIIHRVTSPFDSPTHYYKVMLAIEDGIETSTLSDLDEVYATISDFYEGEESNGI